MKKNQVWIQWGSQFYSSFLLIHPIDSLTHEIFVMFLLGQQPTNSGYFAAIHDKKYKKLFNIMYNVIPPPKYLFWH